MRHWGWLTVCIIAAGVLCTGCGERSARSHRTAQSDEQLAELFNLQRMVGEAESEVLACVKADTAQWVQHELGWWYRYRRKSPEHVEYTHIPAPDSVEHTCHETACRLDGTLLLDAIRPVTQAMNEPFAYRIMVRELTPGDTLEMLIPWNMGYGRQGNDFVPPCTNLHVQLNLHTYIGQDL